MRPSKLLFIFLTTVLLSSFSMAQQDKSFGTKYLNMYMGIQTHEVLSHLPPGAEFYGDYKSNVRAELDRERKTLRFTPKKPGLSTLTVHDRKGNKLFEYRIEVRKSELTRVVREVRSLLSDIEGIQIKIANNKVLIDGKVMLPRDLNRIFGVKKQFGGLVDSLVEINPIAQKKIAEIIEREINNPDIEVRAINGKFILKGIASSPAEKETAEIIAKTYVPAPVINVAEQEGVIKKRKEQVVINLLTVRSPPAAAPEKIIQLVVHYVELSKKYLRSSAFQWAPSLGTDNSSVEFNRTSGGDDDGIVTQISGVINNLIPRLNSAKSHGFARILKSTSVTTKEGKTGVVQSNVNVPYIVRQPGNVATNITQFAQVGVSSEITPKIINPRNDIIELNMKFSVSNLLSVTSSGPQTANNVVNTVINVRSGQSAAIGGLIANSSNTDYNPDPETGAIVNLYSAKDYRRNKEQFVIFVTPIIKASASAGSEKIKRKFRLQE